MILAQREMLAEREAALSEAQNDAKVRALEIERLKLQLAKARREHFGQSSERSKLLVEQLELAIEELEETQAEEETKAEISAPETAKAQRRRPQCGPRKLPENLPVERVVEPRPVRLRQVRRRAAAQARRGGVRRRSNASRGAGRSSSACARSSPVGTARRSPSRRRRRTRSRAASPARACSP